MPKQIPWSPEQLAFFSALEDSSDSLLLSAVAGSGKTTTLTERASSLRGSILAVAFNVKIKRTLEEKIGTSAECLTMNALGHRALTRMLNRGVKIDRDKMRKIISQLAKDSDFDSAWEAVYPAARLAARAKHHGLIPSNALGTYKALMEDSPESWTDLAIHYDIDPSHEILTLARSGLRISITQSWNGISDFDDQIYLPTLWGGVFNRYDNILVDEAQDLSEIQHKMIRRSLNPSGRLIAVGDPNQAIYGWRGAKADSIKQFIKTFDLHEYGLTVSFRCARSIVHEAQNFVERIQPSDSAPEGSVSTLSSYNESVFPIDSTTLCRNNAPLLRLAYRLIKRGRGVHVLGRDIGIGMKTLVKKLSNKDSTMPLDSLEDLILYWQESECNRAETKKQWSRAFSINDRAESLLAVISASGAQNIRQLIENIDSTFSRQYAPLTHSTIHLAKGLEWNDVFILDSHLMPSRWTTKAIEREPIACAWMSQEETNLHYVAITRAREILTYITTKGWEKC